MQSAVNAMPISLTSYSVQMTHADALRNKLLQHTGVLLLHCCGHPYCGRGSMDDPFLVSIESENNNGHPFQQSNSTPSANLQP